MQELIIQIMDQFGYLGVCFLVAVENIFPPIPSEVILTFGGFMTTYTRLTVPGVVIFSTLGSTIGALVLYWAGTALSPQRLDTLMKGRAFKWLGFEREDMEKTVQWFDKHGKKAILLGRCVPIIRSLVSVPAGMAQISIPLFLTYTIIGSTVWNILLVSLGAVLGASWETVLIYIGRYSAFIKAALVVTVLFFVIRLVKKKIS
ncbi:DedA family protein [Muricomes intestini]|jgi:alkaline phosphatase|uniref:Alkaline phosphatase n=2 Tax=Muricomes intestini TaxID=1796634 RepID=A0A4R3KBS3_9FIRM|nr:DedA family protein [Muricomes intestini]TCS80644.1 alkaline phosphatase [Muricomes intestini]HAX50827.1 alkaline phosphatase [Lachnospiraceae bacterium]HCR83137.1 alkaline phosphatase [Lachnospiraceae bacterium]